MPKQTRAPCIRSFGVSVVFAGCFASAVVLAQSGGGAQEKAAVQEAKTAKQAGAKPSPFDPPRAGNGVIGPAADPPKPVNIQKGKAKKVVVAGAQPNRAPLVQQFTNQARPLLRAELIFARHVCHLNREELRKLNEDAQKMLDEVVTKLVDAQFQPRARVQMGGGQKAGMMGGQVRIPGRPDSGLDARELLAEGVVTVMKQDLSREQWSIYEAERQKRDENRKRMTIRYFVDAIDRELYLSKVQRERLKELFEHEWQPAWALYLENHLYGNRYYPMTVDAVVTPVLTEAQKKAWQGVQKVGIYWGFAGMLGGFANDADGLEIELGEPARKERNVNGMIGGLQMEMQIQAGDVFMQRAQTITVRSTKKAAPAVAAPKPAAREEQKETEKKKD